ncbi:AAA family ATPase [Cryomorpha ignava]|uniref:AAA family ATPase n=1 Tax=Cryomorpha ignava TaxID=101383 RepID=A0A7K3WK23_9FLAO|nr:AAA family ATPase [Cryomorpha ignava]NEN22000.1 AAA family ATPase [Cryomorpha ignava]
MPKKSNSTYLVGIAGGSASGKSSILKELLNHFHPEDISFVTQDNYYLDRLKQAVDEKGEVNFDLPTAIDREALVNDVEALLKGETVIRKEYTFNNPKVIPEYVEVKPAKILIVEGLFVFHFSELAQRLDLRVYIDARDDVKLLRRLKRDALERGYSESDVRYRWENHVKPCYKSYLRPYRDHCDVVLTNNVHYIKGLNVLVNHLKTLV